MINNFEKIRRDKIRKAHKGKIISEEQRKNIALAKIADKNPMFGKTGILHHNSKKVNQYDLEGNLIKVWDSLSDIDRFFSLKPRTAYRILKNKTKKLKEFKFEYSF